VPSMVLPVPTCWSVTMTATSFELPPRMVACCVSLMTPPRRSRMDSSTSRTSLAAQPPIRSSSLPAERI